MRTIKTTIYNFDELTETSKKKAIEKYRNLNYDCSYYYDDIINSVKAALELFDLKTGREYTDIRYGHIDDAVLKLSGERLYKYIVNNYLNDLFKPRYIKTIDREIKCKQFKCTYFKNRDGKKFTQIYSRNFFTDSCVLTGVCYDDDILQPVYKFLKSPDNQTTFEDIIKEIENSITKIFNDTENWINSTEFIIEEIEANNYEFTEDGNII